MNADTRRTPRALPTREEIADVIAFAWGEWKLAAAPKGRLADAQADAVLALIDKEDGASGRADSSGGPAVGDVFEHRYGAKGKRIRLIAFHDSGIPYKRYFETEVVAHPASPKMVGVRSWVRADRLRTSQFRRVDDDG